MIQSVSNRFDPFTDGELEAAVPATESQREIWASVQMGDDANCAYNESVSLTWRGSFDVTAMREALASTIQRHEALRAVFSADGTTLCIARERSIEIPLLDLSALEPSEREARLKELKRRDVVTPFDLVHGPLVRATLVRLEDTLHAMVLTTHHLICDGWAIDVVVRDMAASYAGRLHGVTFFLGEPERFSRYAQWLADNLETPEMQTQEAFWLKLYADGGPVVDFPTTRPRPAMRTFESARLDVPMPAALIEGAKRVAAQCDCSFVTVVLGAFNLLLHRLSGQDDVAVGLPAAGQSLTGAQDLVGHCVNLLALRSRVDWDETFAQYVRRLRTVMLDAYEHQSVTFGRLVRKLKLTRDPSRIPLVPIVFNIDQGINIKAMQFVGLETTFRANPRAFENFELFLNMAPVKDGFMFECTYNTNLFDADSIRRRMTGLLALLEAVIQNPEQGVAQLPIMDATERVQILQTWNDTVLDYERQTSLPALFERQAAATPQAEALVVGATRWTYATLNAHANRLAHRLRALGVGPDGLVAVCLERQAPLIATLLGVQKAGGAYVALDPAYPRDRLSYMLTDSKATLVVTTKALAERVGAPGVRVVAIDDSAAPLEKEPDTNPGIAVGPDQLAYVLYTSGSTGKPKGVAIPHRGPLALLAWARTVYTAEELAGVLASTSICFDLSVFEIFLPLTSGGRVILADNAMALAGLPAAREVTLLNTVPSAMTQLLRERALPESVRTVNLAGELLMQALVKQIYALPHIRHVYDLYGPTEDTTYSTWVRRTADGSETIGRPIANTSAYVLDARLQPVPVGVPGELYLGGEGLARGYLHRPDLTAERFVDNPVTGAAHPRLYRTGDRVSFLPDGNLVFLGRLDRQAKVRGFRIEMGEIETVLQSHGYVARAVVIVREDQPGELLLTAYLVPREGRAGALPTATELRKFLRAWLPDFMIPQFFVELGELPMTPNGKVDRAALPSPRRAGGPREVVAPRTKGEQCVAAIWCNVLKLPKVGVRDNFFDLGGHSLLAIEAVARLNEEAGVRLSPRLLMFHTIEQIAPMLDEKPATG